MKTILLFTLLSLSCLSQDSAMAEALTTAGIKHLAAGRAEIAKDCLYHALSLDGHCRAAFELAKLHDRDGDKIEAVSLYQRTIVTTSDGSSRIYAEARCVALNPQHMSLVVAFRDYSRNMDAIARAHPDATTLNACSDRINELRMDTILRPESMPKMYPDGSINLLSIMRASDCIPAAWGRRGVGIMSPPTGICKIEIPYVPPESYEFSVEFKRLDDTGVVGILVPVGGVWQQLWHENDHINLYGRMDLRPFPFKAGDTRVLAVRVTGSRVEAINGKITYAVDRPVQAPEWLPKNSLVLGLGVKNCRAEVLSVTVKELSGHGRKW